MEEQPQKRPPGLRFNGRRPIWRASKAAIAKGFPLKSVHLSQLANDPVHLRQRCERLQAEMLSWLNGRKTGVDIIFDGTFRSLLDVYQTDKQSSYHTLKRSSRLPYDVYVRMMRAEIGERLIDNCDGRDVARWFEAWSAPAVPGGSRQVAKARMAIAVLKAALTFGIMCRKPGCPEFRAVIDAMRFEGLPARTAIVTADQIAAARAAAHAQGHPGAALAYAIQFEGTVRQWDVVGQWIPLSDRLPSAVIYKGKKWIGPTWANVDENLILRFTPTKTENTTAPEIVIDLAACPMVMEELQDVPQAARKGPLIVDQAKGRPYSADRFNEVWRAATKAAGIPADVWNRDLRKSGSTEARQSGAHIDDLQKLMGHAPGSPTTATVYDQAALEAHRRIAEARKIHRGKK
jgi:Phage integrase family